MNTDNSVNWYRFLRLLASWGIFYLLLHHGLFWLDNKGFSFQNHDIDKTVIIHSLIILMIARTFNALSRIFIWDYILPKILKGRVPYLLIQCVSLCVYIIAILVITGTIFGQSIFGFLATLGGLGVLIGLAIQPLMLDAFSGILFDLDSAYSLGDFIKIDIGKDVIMGRVTDVSWRLTIITTPEDSEISIPNHILSGATILNFSRPTPISEFEQFYHFDPVESEKIITEILTNAVLSVVETGCIDRNHPTKVRLSRINHTEGAVYKIKYHLDPVKNGPGKVKHYLHNAVMKHVKAAGIHFYDSGIINLKSNKAEKIEKQKIVRIELLKTVPIFDDLDLKEYDYLLANMKRHIFKPKCVIVSQGDDAASLYILEKGFAKVHIHNDEIIDSVVGILNPGDFFGEMSLLTGEKASATVKSETEIIAYEITKEIITTLVHENPQLCEDFAEVIADKILSTKNNLQQHLHTQNEKHGLVSQSLLKIRSFFHK